MIDDFNQNENENAEYVEYREFSESIEINTDDPIPDGKHLVKKKRRERLVRKGRMKQERFRAFMRFYFCLFYLFFGLIYAFKSSRLVHG